MPDLFGKGLASLVIHLRHHHHNLKTERRPDEKESIDQQAHSIRRGLERFKLRLDQSSGSFEGVESLEEYFTKLDELFVEREAQTPRRFRDALLEAVANLIEWVVSILRKLVALSISGEKDKS